MDQNILNWIEEKRKKGYTSEQLKNSLIQNGHNPEEVNQAINSSFNETYVNTNPASPKKYNKKYLLIIPLIILLLAIGIYFFLNLQGYFTATEGNVKVEHSDNGSTKIILSTGDIPSNECMLSRECSEGLECIQNKCVTINEFYNEHVACCEEGMTVEGVSACDLAKQNTDNIVYSCEQYTCENCEKGVQSCIYEQTNGFFSYCAECLNRFNCKEGFNCKYGKCVQK